MNDVIQLFPSRHVLLLYLIIPVWPGSRKPLRVKIRADLRLKLWHERCVIHTGGFTKKEKEGKYVLKENKMLNEFNRDCCWIHPYLPNC